MGNLFRLMTVLLLGNVCLAACPFGFTGSMNRMMDQKSHFHPSGNLPSACHHFPKRCRRREKYRRIDGSCNNLDNPEWGMANSTYDRLLLPVYSDGISAPRKTNDKNSLPGVRTVRTKLFPADVNPDPGRSLLTMQWGQIVAHDMSNLMEVGDDAVNCCSDNYTSSLSDLCYSVFVPPDDPTQGKVGITCINFTRTITDRYLNCSSRSEPAKQISTVTPYLDLSIVYGNDEETCNSLRSMSGGELKIEVRNSIIFPQRESDTQTYCRCNTDSEDVCYKTGDPRMNQSPHLAILHIILVREHNRIARSLSEVNPHWDDTKLFNEARRINIAQHQYITYYEWMPTLLGHKYLVHSKIIFPKCDNFVDDYDDSLIPNVFNEHAHAAFRVFHSQIAGMLNLMNSNHESTSSVNISEWLWRPVILERYNITGISQLTRGLVGQLSEKTDPIFSEQVVDKLFACQGIGFGEDLRSTDMQRDRDHALSYYNNYRKLCGLKFAKSFDDFTDYISIENVKILKTLYSSHQDVDLSVGGALESHVPGAQVGPTFLCIMTEQFRRTRRSDRFWFENKSSGLNSAQLAEIRKSSMSRILCNNGDGINNIQPNAFLSRQPNSSVSCDKICSMDLSKWKDSKWDS